MELALEAILGHKSAHSRLTGPRIAEPFISPLLYYDAGIVFKVYKHAVFSSDRFPLSDYYCRHYLFSKFGFSLLYGSYDHVSAACCRHSVQTTTDSSNRDNIEILTTCIVSTIDDG